MGGGQFGALSPGFFVGAFLVLAARPLGAGVGRALVFAVPGAVVGGGGAWGLGLEKWTVNCSFTWSVTLKILFAVGWEEKNEGIKEPDKQKVCPPTRHLCFTSQHLLVALGFSNTVNKFNWKIIK